MKATAAESYQSTYDNILQRLCNGRLLHVDETSISVKGVSGGFPDLRGTKIA